MTAMRPGNAAKSLAYRACALIAGLLVASFATAEYRGVDDIKAFGLLDVKGHFTAGYLLDERARGTSGSSDFEDRVTWEEDLFILTESFIYHPGFLNMDIGGGPLLVQQQFDSTMGNNRSSDTLFNYLARFNFLEIKNYPFSFYFERTHPSVTTSLAGRFLTQDDRAGFDQHIGGLFGGSTTLAVSLSRQDTNGEGFGSVVDNTVDRALVSATTSYRDRDVLEFRVDWLDQESASGSAGLPIQRSLLEQRINEVRAENHFGDNGRLMVRQFLRRLQQDRTSFDVFMLDDLTYQGDVRWQHRDGGHTFLSFHSLDATRTDADLKLSDAALGFVRQINQELNVDAAIGHLSDEQTGFQRDESNVRGAFTYGRDTGFGRIGVAGSLRAARTDQVSDADEIQVIGEQLTLNGTTPVDLVNEFVVAGSVVISNQPRTQIYVEGLDYRLLTVGGTTSVQRLITGAITDGETVLADYSFDTPGTADFDTLGAGLSLNVNFFKTADAFIRYDQQDTDIKSGMLTNPVNDRRRLELGFGMTNQFLDGWSLSGQYRHTQNEEEISPYDSDTLNLSVSTSLRGVLQLVLSTNLSNVDYENSPEDIDQVGYRVAVSGRLSRRGRFAYEASFLEDTGGTQARRDVRHRLNYRWAYRQLRFELLGTYMEETLGITERTDLRVTANVMRVF